MLRIFLALLSIGFSKKEAKNYKPTKWEKAKHKMYVQEQKYKDSSFSKRREEYKVLKNQNQFYWGISIGAQTNLSNPKISNTSSQLKVLGNYSTYFTGELHIGYLYHKHQIEWSISELTFTNGYNYTLPANISTYYRNLSVEHKISFMRNNFSYYYRVLNKKWFSMYPSIGVGLSFPLKVYNSNILEQNYEDQSLNSKVNEIKYSHHYTPFVVDVNCAMNFVFSVSKSWDLYLSTGVLFAPQKLYEREFSYTIYRNNALIENQDFKVSNNNALNLVFNVGFRNRPRAWNLNKSNKQ